jgi:hypothetical protein
MPPSGKSYIADLDESSIAAKQAKLGTNLDTLIKRTNQLLNFAAGGEGLISTPNLRIGTTDDQIRSDAFSFFINGVIGQKAAVAAGTAPGAQTVPADKWAIYKLSIAANGTITVTPAAANATTGYDTEVLALAANPATPANEANMGHVTVKTAAGQAWVAATDSFEGGAAGNPASVTHYYNAPLSLDPTPIVELNSLP